MMNFVKLLARKSLNAAQARLIAAPREKAPSFIADNAEGTSTGGRLRTLSEKHVYSKRVGGLPPVGGGGSGSHEIYFNLQNTSMSALGFDEIKVGLHTHPTQHADAVRRRQVRILLSLLRMRTRENLRRALKPPTKKYPQQNQVSNQSR